MTAPTFMRSTYGQIPFENNEALEQLLQRFQISPTPRFKPAKQEGLVGSLEISGPGVVLAGNGLLEECLPKLAVLLQSSTVMELFMLNHSHTGKNGPWWRMGHVVLANIRGSGRVTRSMTFVPVPILPVVVEVCGGVVANVYTDYPGELIVVDDTTEDEHDGELQAVVALAELAKAPNTEVYAAVCECLDRNEVVHDWKRDA